MVDWKRIVKTIVVGGAVFGSLGFYANSRLRLTADYAVVAGPAISVRSPGDGVLSHSARNFSILQAGSSVATIAPTPINDPALREAAVELETARADVASLKALIALGGEMRSKTLNRQSALGSRRAEHLERLMQQANSEVATRKAAMDGAELAHKRSLELCSQSLLGSQDCEAAETRAEVEKGEYESAERQANIAKFLLESTRSGVDIGQDMGSEVTYARQQKDELTFRLAALQQQLETREAQAKALELRVSPPPIGISVPSKSRVWSTLHHNGTLVGKGDPLFQVVDCTQLFVFATISEDRYEKLRIGMTAEVIVEGRRYQGKLVQLLGPYGTFAQEGGMQPQPPVILNNRDASNAAVAVEAPELTASLGKSCEIGTRVEVEFTK